MKKTSFIILIILSSINIVYAQTIKFIPNPNLDKFVGTWVCQNDEKTVFITLQKKLDTVKNVSFYVIEGYYTFAHNDEAGQKGKPTLKFGRTFSDDGVKTPNALYLSFYDLTRKKGGDLILKMTLNNPDELIWTLHNTEGVRVAQPGRLKSDPTFSLPIHMIFEREQ